MYTHFRLYIIQSDSPDSKNRRVNLDSEKKKRVCVTSTNLSVNHQEIHHNEVNKIISRFLEPDGGTFCCRSVCQGIKGGK